ncbi:hypothetical protein AB0E88_05435 [Streptomyces sp. NPDC028635]|uniref:hypothetical protein n=1 Tax=Streptomyces sp. NPDC028635 TaxID=3154800 RepID=UPI0033DCAE6E
MSQVGSRPSGLLQPLGAVASGLRRLPGAEQVGRFADDALDRIGAISPRGRRLAVYTGAGVLGVAGVVEWPVALAGAAVAWLTQPRPERGAREGADTESFRGASGEGDGAGTAAGGAEGPGPVPVHADGTAAEEQGAGDRLAPSRFHRGGPEEHVHEEPAKVGDPATASALKQVAEATAHHHGPDQRNH